MAAPRRSPLPDVTGGACHRRIIAFALLYGVWLGVFDCTASSVSLKWSVQCPLSGMGCSKGGGYMVERTVVGFVFRSASSCVY